MFKLVFFAFFVLTSFQTMAADIEADKAILRGVDKITGRISTMEVAVGETIEFGKLQILLNKCLTKPIEEAPENAAFLTIVKKKGKEGFESVFNGWMFSSNPALSAMEDPVYDVWVISCSQNEPNFEEQIKQIQPVLTDNAFVVMENLQEDVPNDLPNHSIDTEQDDSMRRVAPLVSDNITIETLD